MTISKYDHRLIEKHWQEVWKKEKTYSPDIKSSKKPFYNLMMFPYPSAEGLHVGNMYAFTGADVYGRFKRMQGMDVFEPIGLDGFGIHSENYAIKVGRHPKEHAKISEQNFYRQLHMIGNGFDWDHKLETYDVDYYKWTQWLFVQMFKKGLAYKDSAMVNWCPGCKTVLADEQALSKTDDNGQIINVCERCGTQVERREMSSWYFKITDYADRLLTNIEKIDWPEKIKIAQRQWIGKSKGLTIGFPLTIDGLPAAGHGSKFTIKVWTKFWETVYGVTFLVVSPEYARDNLLKFIPKANKNEVEEYIRQSLNKSEQARSEKKEKSGVLIGIEVTNPVNRKKVPVFVADYVLANVGTGAVMGVPAHDERDFAFAKKYKLPVIRVVSPNLDYYRSYLMGGKNISDQELEKLNIKLIEKTKSGRKIEIPKNNISEYDKLIESRLENGFWNEYIGDEIVFIFKDKDGGVQRFILSSENEREITKLANVYTKGSISLTDCPWNFLADVNVYKDLIIHESGGKIENSEQFDGLDAWGEGKERIANWMIKVGFAKWETNYHLRDWLISRQRYWGPPIPMINCSMCGWQSVPEKDLPVVLPDIKDFKPQGDGTSPLHNAPRSWKSVKCPNCGGKAERELDVSDTFLDSAWYFLRYPSINSPVSHNVPIEPQITKKWLPVNAYIGGAEHAVLHLLYARFVTMFLKDQGYLDFEEPFPFLFGHGLIIKDGAKMSKSKGNIVNPDEYIDKFGADTLRSYLMFLGPFNQGGDFRDTGIEGMNRFLQRVWRLFEEAKFADNGQLDSESLSIMHKTIKKVTDDVANFKYNTAISAIMEYVNFLTAKKKIQISTQAFQVLAKLLAPFTPHLAEELWERHFLTVKKAQKPASKKIFKSIHHMDWPVFDEKYLVSDTVSIVVQVNGKLRGTIEMDTNKAKDKELVLIEAKKLENVSKWLIEEPKKVIFVSGKLLNLVV